MIISIDGVPISNHIETINVKEADVPQSHDNKLANFGNYEISGTLPRSKEFDEILSKLNELAEEEFQKHKIKKIDYFKDVSQAPTWLEDEFQICDMVKCDSLQKGKWVMYPWDIYQGDIIKYGTAIIKERVFDVTYKRVLLIVGTRD